MLEDLAVDCEARDAVIVRDLVTLDPEGIHILIHAVISRLPLALPKKHDRRSHYSLEDSGKLCKLLQR